MADPLETLAVIKDSQGNINAEAFLSVCRYVVSIVEKLGTAFYPVKADLLGNIERVEKKILEDKARFASLFSIIDDDVAQGHPGGAYSVTKGLLWLQRAMRFVVLIVDGVNSDPSKELYTVVNEMYKATLYQYHGYFASTVFTTAFNFVPSRASFLEKLGEDATPERLRQLTSGYTPILDDVHKGLADRGLDDPAKV